MRCPDCNKFVSYDEPECEINSVELSGEEVTASVRVVLKCAECCGELKDAEIESTATFEHTCVPISERGPEWQPEKVWKPKDGQFEIESDGDASGTNRVQTTDRHGKPIKFHRYMKTFYGFEMDTEIKCRKCGEVFHVHLEGEEQASGFNELV